MMFLTSRRFLIAVTRLFAAFDTAKRPACFKTKTHFAWQRAQRLQQ
jgi:hypothetical protein